MIERLWRRDALRVHRLPHIGVVVASAVVLVAGQPATAQYSSDFEAPLYAGSADGTILTDQDKFYIPVPDSQDGLVYTYADNALGLPANPSGGGKQFAGVTGGDPGLPVPNARAQRDLVYGDGTGVWTVSFDIAATYLGELPSAQNIGSFSPQLFPGEATYIALARWTDPETATNWDADYVWFNRLGDQVTEPVADPAFQGLDDDHWYRWSTTFNLDTNQILQVSITDLTTGVTSTHSPSGRYLFGGAGGAPTPTGFRLFGGSAGAAGNTLAFDNISIDLAGDPPLGACCLQNDSCVVLTEADCTAAGGIYSGDGTACTPITCVEIPPTCGKGQGPCNEPHGNPGCDDVECCVLVCDPVKGDPFCCKVEWDQQCVDAAIDIGCTLGFGQPIDLATGPDETIDGYLRINTDGYGSWADPGFGNSTGDTYNPAGPANGPTTSPSFTNGFFLMRRAAQERELLSTNDAWQDVGSDGTMNREITLSGEVVDTNGDGVPDTRVSEFNVTSQSGMDITIELTQHVETVTPLGGDPVALVHFDMVITNNGPAVDFELVRHLDLDLTFNDSEFSDDSVGTGTNDSKADRFIYQGEAVDGAADPTTTIVFSSPDGGEYYGGKGGGPVQDPKDCCTNPDFDCPAYGAGTDVQVWNAYGVPDCWANYIVNVGLNTDGDSDTMPGGDGFIGLAIPVSLAAEGVTKVSAMLTYGATVPGGGGPPPCPWDLDGNNDVGIGDLLIILADWGNPYGIGDLLALLAAWGPCP